MRFTRSQARAQAAENGQAALLQAVATTNTDPYAFLDFSDSSSEASNLPPPEPLRPVNTCHVSVQAMAVYSVLPAFSCYLQETSSSFYRNLWPSCSRIEKKAREIWSSTLCTVCYSF
jgi:hypothetical protein